MISASLPSLADLPAELSVSVIDVTHAVPQNLLEICTDDSFLFAGSDFTLLARGIAHAFRLRSGLDDLHAIEDIVAVLRAIPVRTSSLLGSTPGRGPGDLFPAPPVVMAAMPFDRSAEAQLVLPQVLIAVPKTNAYRSHDVDGFRQGSRRDLASSSAPARKFQAVAIVTGDSSDHQALLEHHLGVMLGSARFHEPSSSGSKATFSVADVLARDRFVDIVSFAIAIIGPAAPTPLGSKASLATSSDPGRHPSSHRIDEVELAAIRERITRAGVNLANLEAASALDKLEKVVLAREVIVTADRRLSPRSIATRLSALELHSTVFAIDGFVGASPELLISRFGAHVASRPLAGTLPPSTSALARCATRETASAGSHTRDGAAEQAGNALRLPPKDLAEHRFVVDAVAAALSPLCKDVDVPATPDIVHLHAVSHLGTHVSGLLEQRRGRSGYVALPSSLELLARVHPTPAVAGTPRTTALRFISALEGFDRGRYAGPVGWMDSKGNGVWMLGIRGATLAGNAARVATGAGIVAGSDPLTELEETDHKLLSTLDAITGATTAPKAIAGAHS